MMIDLENYNEQIKNEFLKTVSGGRRPHAVLIDGGTEKEREDIAYLLAKVYGHTLPSIRLPYLRPHLR